MLSDAEKLFPAVRYGYSTMIDDRNFIKETPVSYTHLTLPTNREV